MPNVNVYSAAGEVVGEVALNDAVFGIEPHVPSMHLAVRSYLANQRLGTQSTLTRGEVRGGGKKPWRQKGSGRARQGSTRSPQWIHGGIALGPKPRDYVIGLNRKVKRLALKSALSSKVRDDEIKVLESFGLEEIKTKEVAKVLAALKTGKKTLIITKEADTLIYKSARNIAGVKIAPVNALTTYEILDCNTLLVLQDAVVQIEALHAPHKSEKKEDEAA
ncbi:MAG: 50S ribosomal protein L4 [Oscillospiraceae bacterium]|jgi:large subunit ribosomal protein L4|nr:50S ribosomal protein L4 [Oscillospiraceae bacterium]